ncbi:hypothetical protein BH23VER1_BH23VER1_09100 [soil metagenome]
MFATRLPDVHFVRDRLGQSKVVKDGALLAGTIDSPFYNYTYSAAYPPRLTAEKLETAHAGFSATAKVLERTYSSAGGGAVPNRYTGLTLYQGATEVASNAYIYDTAGRISSVEVADHATVPFTLQYLTNSRQISSGLSPTARSSATGLGRPRARR